jgi:hypothetical protein
MEEATNSGDEERWNISIEKSEPIFCPKGMKVKLGSGQD